MATQQDNWEAAKALFEAALEEDPANRSSFLKEQCSDASVCAEVERLLAEHDEAKSFLRTRLSDLSTASMTIIFLTVLQLLSGFPICVTGRAVPHCPLHRRWEYGRCV